MADKCDNPRKPLAATDSNKSFFNTVLAKDSFPLKPYIVGPTGVPPTGLY